LTKKGFSQGIATVTIDGVNKGNVDLYSATPQAFTKAYTGLSTGTHTITIKVTGTKNAASSNTWVAVDGFKVGTTTVQDDSWKVAYNAWNGVSSASASGGTYRNSSLAASSFRYTFSGTSVDWITATGPGWGRAKVFIDGVDKGTVDLYAPTQTWKTVKTYAGLSSGTHTIQVKPLGTKSASSTSTKVVVDAFIAR
jgi:bacillopeptidase F